MQTKDDDKNDFRLEQDKWFEGLNATWNNLKYTISSTNFGFEKFLNATVLDMQLQKAYTDHGEKISHEDLPEYINKIGAIFDIMRQIYHDIYPEDDLIKENSKGHAIVEFNDNLLMNEMLKNLKQVYRYDAESYAFAFLIYYIEDYHSADKAGNRKWDKINSLKYIDPSEMFNYLKHQTFYKDLYTKKKKDIDNNSDEDRKSKIDLIVSNSFKYTKYAYILLRYFASRYYHQNDIYCHLYTLYRFESETHLVSYYYYLKGTKNCEEFKKADKRPLLQYRRLADIVCRPILKLDHSLFIKLLLVTLYTKYADFQNDDMPLPTISNFNELNSLISNPVFIAERNVQNVEDEIIHTICLLLSTNQMSDEVNNRLSALNEIVAYLEELPVLTDSDVSTMKIITEMRKYINNAQELDMNASKLY